MLFFAVKATDDGERTIFLDPTKDFWGNFIQWLETKGMTRQEAGKLTLNAGWLLINAAIGARFDSHVFSSEWPPTADSLGEEYWRNLLP